MCFTCLNDGGRVSGERVTRRVIPSFSKKYFTAIDPKKIGKCSYEDFSGKKLNGESYIPRPINSDETSGQLVPAETYL